ncbi:tyrosine-type recombinase/integrase [Tumebacillus permanentifrigoris]|uniref:Integrase/recombinase XerC n=1 Tax=Tumebacillus permanentifrigoris TaxID=378543 RepID=A0A316DDM6_9BACL|nr:tyrosine-type recombinase/integrase [Tumebacillus permanentifrigoris]PWK15728.1 integrase/recombinase XerC [Tumebacillus permanentifrigoris]
MTNYLQQFSTWLKDEDKADKTISTYVTALNKFVLWYEQSEGKTFEPQYVTTIMIQDYRSYMMNTLDQKPATINKALAALKTFFSWAVDKNHIPTDPASKVRMKRVQQVMGPKWMTDQEINRLTFALDTETNEFKAARDRAIFYTMFRAGLRVEEVSNLKLTHVDFWRETVTVMNGKGGKFRVIPMHQELKKALKAWLPFRNASEKPVHQESEYLLVTERSGKMTTRAIEHMLDSYLERCGLLERSADGMKLGGQHSCHSLRHTFGKRLVDAGRQLNEVKELMGHDNVQTTMRYVEPSQNDLRRAINAVR